MSKFLILAAAGAAVIATPAAANHVNNLTTPFASLGACEVERNALSNDDDWLLDAFPQLFSSEGEVRSFLNRAFPCELRADGNYYMIDQRQQVLDSTWFQRRNR